MINAKYKCYLRRKQTNNSTNSWSNYDLTVESQYFMAVLTDLLSRMMCI